MHRSLKRRSSSNPARIFDREGRSLNRNDRRTQSKSGRSISIENSHIPRPRCRSSGRNSSSSMDRAAGSLGRKSYLKPTGKTPQHQNTLTTTPITPSNRYNLVSATASASRLNVPPPLSIRRSPSGDRASSVGAKGPRKDTRPLTDKAYQMSLLNNIDNFFRVSQRSTMLNSNGSLKPITLKMFVEVSSLFLKSFGIKQELTMTIYVEELPKCAKKLHYPGVMTKSWLKTANAMHSWPYVLGWIGWLVETCQVTEIAFDKYQLETLPFIGTEEQAYRYKMEFLALLECYKAWNDEKADEEAELLERYMQDVLIQQGVTDEDIARMHHEIKDTSKLQILEKENLELDKIIAQKQAELSFLCAEETKKLENIKAKEDYIKNCTTETKQLNVECKILNEKIRIQKIQKEELSQNVETQTMSKAQKEQIVKKCTEKQNYICEFEKHLKDYKKELYTLDIKLATFNNNINKAILAYNKELFMNVDVNNDVSMNFDDLKLPEKGLLDSYIMDVLREKVASTKIFKEKLIQQCNEIQSIICSDTIKLEKLQEEVKSLSDENELKDKMSHVDEMKENMKKEKTKLIKQIEVLKNELKEMQDMMPNVQTTELEIEEANDKLDAVARRKAFLEQTAKQFFERLYEITVKHRSELYDILTKNKK